MPCYHPITGYRSKTVNENGKRPIVFNRNEGYIDMPVEVPCGRCIGCRLERSKQWAIRCVQEAKMHEKNCFITLTYDQEHLPKDGSLDVTHYQKFMKRLRKHFNNKKVRYFHCGEYGEKLSRPHYHACLFGVDFDDKKLWSVRNNNKLYRSETLEKLWTFGYSTIGEVTFESAAYIARYVTKKINGDMAEDHYKGKKPEYITMSRRPGIGHDWFTKYIKDVYPNDFVMIRNNIKTKPSRYYDKLLEKKSEDDILTIKAKRKRRARESEHNSSHRLKAREKCKLAQTKNLKRSYENA